MPKKILVIGDDKVLLIEDGEAGRVVDVSADMQGALRRVVASVRVETLRPEKLRVDELPALLIADVVPRVGPTGAGGGQIGVSGPRGAMGLVEPPRRRFNLPDYSTKPPRYNRSKRRPWKR